MENLECELNINKLYEEISQSKYNNDINDKILEENEHTKEYCNICNSETRIEKYGLLICKTCGTQTNIIIDSSLESRDYGQNDTKVRTTRCDTFKSDMVSSNSSFSSIVLNDYKSNNNIISKIHSWNSRTYEENTLQQDLNNMKVLSENYGINNCIIKEAQTIYKQISEQKHKKKDKKISIQAACVQCACKLYNVPRDTNEMSLIFNIPKKEIRRGCKQFEEIWCIINENNNSSLYKELRPSNSVDFLLRRCQQLKLSDEIIDICKEVCLYIEKEDFLIKHIPLSRVAVGIYFTCYHLNININKNHITDICGISEVTINKCFQKLLKIKDKIIDNTRLVNIYIDC